MYLILTKPVSMEFIFPFSYAKNSHLQFSILIIHSLSTALFQSLCMIRVLISQPNLHPMIFNS